MYQSRVLVCCDDVGVRYEEFALNHVSKRGDVLNTRKLILGSTVILFIVGYFFFAIRPIEGFSWGDRIDLGDGYILTMPFHAVAGVIDEDEVERVWRPYLPLKVTPLIPGGIAVAYLQGDYVEIFDDGVQEFAEEVRRNPEPNNYFRETTFEGNRVVLVVEDKVDYGSAFIYWLKPNKPLYFCIDFSPLFEADDLRSRPIDELIADAMRSYGIKKIK